MIHEAPITHSQGTTGVPLEASFSPDKQFIIAGAALHGQWHVQMRQCMTCPSLPGN